MEIEDTTETRLLADTDEETHTSEPQLTTSKEPSDFSAVFSLFQSYLDKKLVDLKDDLREETRHTTDYVASKLKETAELSFKYKGNQQQHKFNRGLADKVSEASSALERKNIPQVSACLTELAKHIKRRNKLIRLADKSPAGWDLVNEYLSDELASGSEDEKKIRKAEKSALTKRNNRQRARSTRRVHPYPSSSTTTTPGPHRLPQSQFPLQPSGLFQRSNLRKAGPTDICFACGLQGHWRVDCRRVSSSRINADSGTPSHGGGNRLTRY